MVDGSSASSDRFRCHASSNRTSSPLECASTTRDLVTVSALWRTRRSAARGARRVEVRWRSRDRSRDRRKVTSCHWESSTTQNHVQARCLRAGVKPRKGWRGHTEALASAGRVRPKARVIMRASSSCGSEPGRASRSSASPEPIASSISAINSVGTKGS
jgi:hypothetical protein